MSDAVAGRSTGRSELPWPVSLALRYLRSSRRDAFVSFLSAVAVGGITLGVAALILALSALNGLQAGLRTEVLQRTPEIEVDVADVEASDDLMQSILAVEGVESASRRLSGNGWILLAGSARPVGVFGYEGDLPSTFPEARSRQPGLYLSDRFARHYGLVPGDLVEIASTRSTLSPLGPVPRVRRLPLFETFGHAVLEPRERVALPLADALALLGASSMRIEVATGDLNRALLVANELTERLPAETRIRTWQDLNEPLLLALRLEKRLMFIAVFLIVLVGALALVSDLSLIVASRRREIAILATMGASDRVLRRVFLSFGALLAFAGVLAGSVIGMVLAWLFDRTGWIRLPGDFYLLDHIPFIVLPVDVLWICGATLLLSLLCCWAGAGKVTRLDPVEGLRG